MDSKTKKKLAKKVLMKWLTSDLELSIPEHRKEYKEIEEIVDNSLEEGGFVIEGKYDVLEIIELAFEVAREYYEDKYLPYLAEKNRV